jgi:hypothetical protein
VGYLSCEHEYTKGETSEAVFDRLASLAKLRVLDWLGSHECDLGSCGRTQLRSDLYWRGMRIPEYCSSDILVPEKTIVYMSPALILHYIRVHQYLPPACFVEAVLNCPEPGSEEYRAAIRKIAPGLAAGLD